jgi:NAD(P)-dependent dehydrogenase (short-subunit alcohol dehydrogenase family)
MEDFANKVAVITGAASGIGRALAQRLYDGGALLVLADIDVPHLEATAGEWSPDRVRTVSTDVSRPESLDELARQTLDRFGRVDLLFNNAGVSTFNPIHAQTLEDWQWVLGVDLWGVIHGIRSFLPILRRQGTEAHIINTASIAGVLSGVAYLGPYATSKVAVVSISETLRVELAAESSPIGVSVLCPGNTESGVMESERNRVDGREERLPEAEEFRVAIRDSMTGPTGQTADEVARCTLEAVARGDFWIFTHPEMKPILEARLREMVEAYPDPAPH